MKAQTENEYQKKVNQVIDYISSHLYEPMTLEGLAQRMCISSYHFHRIMRAYLNEPLATYITRQRLERAAIYLQDKRMSLTGVAEKVGYETPQSFSKAFKKQFGFTPAFYRKVFVSDFVLRRKENSFTKIELFPTLCELEKMDLAYIRVIGKYGEEESYTKAWSELGNYLKRTNNLTDETRWIGLSFDDPNITRYKDCRFYACASVKQEVKPFGKIGTILIPPGKFAVYTHKGSYDGLQNLYDNLYMGCPFTLRDAMAFEEYINSPHQVEENDLITKVYIPIE